MRSAYGYARASTRWRGQDDSNSLELQQTALPKIAAEYEQSDLRLLVALCRELQRACGDGPFYLSCRTAGTLLNVTHTTAWRWLFLLEQDDVIRVVSRGSQQSKKASRYRYLGGR